MPKIDGMNWNPVWLPDGRLSYTSMRKGDFDVYVKEVGGTGAEHAVLAGPDDTDPIAWTRDGRLVFQGSEPDGAYPLKLFDPQRSRTRSRASPSSTSTTAARCRPMNAGSPISRLRSADRSSTCGR